MLRCLALTFAFSSLLACTTPPLSDPPRSEYQTITSQALKKKQSYGVYTPSGWSPEERLPLVVLLHGGFDDHTAFDRFKVGEYLDEQIAKNNLPRAIIINPDGDSGFWENWHDGSKLYRDWVTKDLLNDVAAKYTHQPCPEFCHLMGISMGGHGALSIGAHQPDLFASVTAISGSVFTRRSDDKPSFLGSLVSWIIPRKRIWGDPDPEVSGRLDVYDYWLKNASEKQLYLIWGDEDTPGILRFNESFIADLNEEQQNFGSKIYKGRHKWVDWRYAIAESMRVQLKP